jgi:crotonobetainyl-CoA:carnitine CoA-transferase CaiB-like acyl-CoA transferase
MAGQILADMGAVVLKIEPPRGDEMRRLGPRDGAGAALFYETLNAGKTLRLLDLKQPDDHAAMLALATDADVLIEGFRPGVMARLGLDYARLKALNPRIVYCSLSGYGPHGPLAGKAAHDGNYLASSGILDRNGGEPPIAFDPPVSDTTGALYAALSILGALHRRQATGKGCQIDIGLADVLMPLQALQIADWGANGTVPGPRSTYLNGGAAYYQSYATSDRRHVMLGCVEPKFWANFCAAAGHPDWIARQDEPLPQTALIADVSGFFAALRFADAVARFDSVECCFSAVLDLGEALSAEQLRQRGLVRTEPSTGRLQALFPAVVDGVLPRARDALSEAAPQRAQPTLVRKTSNQ